MRKKAIMIVVALFLCQLSYAVSNVENVNQSDVPKDVHLINAYPNSNDETSNTAATSEKIQNTINDGTDETTVLTPAAGDEEKETTLENTDANTNTNTKITETKTKRTNKTQKNQVKTKKEKAKKLTLDEKLDLELSNLTRMLDRLEGR
nr:hypothetical protein [uncultured Leptotrichia sp.]